MSTPQPAAVEEVETDEEDETPDDPFDGEEDAEDEIDLDLAEVDVGEEVGDEAEERLDELDAANAEVPARDDNDDPFDGREDAEWAEEDSWSTDSESTGGSGGGQWDDFGDDFDPGAVSDSINEGAARLAVVGLPEQFEHNGEMTFKDDLEDEFLEVFETFKLGEYGEKAADEYLNVEGDIDPLWGFTASMAVCAVLVVHMRPDGGEIVGKAEAQISQMAGQLGQNL